MYGYGSPFFSLSGDVVELVSDDVIAGEREQIRHAATYAAMEHEQVAVQSEAGVMAEIKFLQFLALVYGEIERCAVNLLSDCETLHRI